MMILQGMNGYNDGRTSAAMSAKQGAANSAGDFNPSSLIEGGVSVLNNVVSNLFGLLGKKNAPQTPFPAPPQNYPPVVVQGSGISTKTLVGVGLVGVGVVGLAYMLKKKRR